MGTMEEIKTHLKVEVFENAPIRSVDIERSFFYVTNIYFWITNMLDQIKKNLLYYSAMFIL